MKIKGVEGMTVDQLRAEIARGGKFVYFPYCISAVVMTFRRSSAIYFIRAGEGTAGKALPFALTSLLLGWWGIPWGLIWTPTTLFTTLSGGKNVTVEVARQLGAGPLPQPVPQPAPQPV
jgi:hypothetical protein